MNSLALALGLVAYNNAMNLWHRFHGRLYVPANLALAATCLAVAERVWNLDARSLGLGPGQFTALLLGAGMGVLAAGPLFLALLRRTTASTVADDRVAGITRGQLLYRALIRVPFGTALPEEVLFRGVLYASLAGAGPAAAAGWSSVAFGLWHIAPTYNFLRENGLTACRPTSAVAAMMGGAVALTALAGLVLAGIRIETGGVAASFGLHATLNSLGTVAAYLANRRAGQP